MGGEALADQESSGRGTLLGAVLLIALGVVAYSNSFAVPFLFDDEASIPSNKTIRRLWPLSKVLVPDIQRATVVGRPVINLSLALNYAFGELDVHGYHAFNLAIHLLAGLTLFGLIRRTLRLPQLPERIRSRSMGLALACVVLWTVHPLQTESVTYIIQRAESLGGLFYLLVLYCFVRSATVSDVGETRRTGRLRSAERWTALAVLCFYLGVGCKEVLVTAPVVVLLYDRFFLSDSFATALRQRRGLYAGLAAGWILQGVLVVSAGSRGNSAGFGVGVTPWQYLSLQFSAILHYLRLSLWPRPLVFDYGKFVQPSAAEVFIPALILLGLVFALFLVARKHRWVGFVALTGALILAPSSSIVPVATQGMAEHRMYLPLAAVVVLAVFAADFLLHRMFGRYGTLAVVSAVAVLGTFGTYQRNHDYRTSLAIWEDTVKKVPNSARARNNYGHQLLAAERLPEALDQLNAAIALRQQDCDPYYNRSVIAQRKGDLAGALADMTDAVRLCPQSELYLVRRGTLLMQAGEFTKAASEFTRALQIAPDSSVYRFERGNCYYQVGRVEDAIKDFSAVLELEPDQSRVWHNRGNAYARIGQLEESIRDLSRAIQLAPALAEPFENRAKSYFEAQKYELAWKDVEQCRKLGGRVDPKFIRLLEEKAPRPARGTP